MINPTFLHLILLPFPAFTGMKFAGFFCPLHPLKGKLIKIYHCFEPSSNVPRKRSLSLSQKNPTKQTPNPRGIYCYGKLISEERNPGNCKINSGRKLVVLVLSAEGLKSCRGSNICEEMYLLLLLLKASPIPATHPSIIPNYCPFRLAMPSPKSQHLVLLLIAAQLQSEIP